MRRVFALTGLALALSLMSIGSAGAQVGPDLVLEDIYATQLWGQVGDIVAYSIGTEICNYGDQDADWIANSNRHPVIAQNLYRLKDGRMEQLGQSWLKHGFASVNGGGCDIPCQNPGTSSRLGVGCSDPYGSGLNGDQDGGGGVGGLGPRSEVNATTGEFLWPYGSQGQSGNAIYKRLQVHVDDVTPALNPNARYFVEGQYVTFDEAQFGNGANNPSYREVRVNADLTLTFIAAVQKEKDALIAWQEIDPTVQLTEILVPGDGAMRLASKVTALGGGQWRYDYSLHNITSHRSVRSFAIPRPGGAVISNTTFNDVDSHSGEPYDLTDWATGTGSPALISWTTLGFGSDPDANALRWGTTYSFGFEADSPPQAVTAKVRLFRPGSPALIDVVTQGPGGTGGGIPCGDIAALQARCRNNNQLQARVLLTDSSHDGESVVLGVDAGQRILPINGDRAVLRETSSPGQHTLSLLDPPGCVPDVVVNCN